MSSQENKLLIKIGKNFEANASGHTAIVVVFLIVVGLMIVGFNFI